MLDTMNDAPEHAASTPPGRAALSEAHAARRDAETHLDAAREAASRGAELLALAETVAQRHRDLAAKSTAERAASLTAAIRAGHADMPSRPRGGAGHGEAAALLQAEQELEVARQAHAELFADVERAEQAFADVRKLVDTAIRGVLREAAKNYQREMNEALSQMNSLTSRLRGYMNSYGSAFDGYLNRPLEFEVQGSLGDTAAWQKFYQALNEDPHASLED